MSWQTIVPANRDAHVRDNRVDANYGGAAQLRAKDDARIYFGFDIDKPKNAHFVSAVLRLTSQGTGWVGTEVISVRKLLEKWAEAKVTWTNRPAADTTVVGGVAAGITAAGQTYDIDVTTLVGLGTGWRGLDVRVTTSGDNRAFRSSENPDKTLRPRLVMTWVEDPLEPVELVPSDSRIIATPNPTLTWDWVSPSEELQQSQVQVSTDPAFGTTVHDSGFIAATEPRYALTAFNLVAGTLYYWRVRVKTASGSESPWSEAAGMKYVAQPALAITAPTEPFSTPTPNVTWTFTGQTKARVYLYKGTSKEPAWVSPWLTTAQTVQVPSNIIRSFGSYRFVVQAWDAQDRQAITGVPDYASATVTRTYSLTASVLPVTALTATIPDPGKPMVRLNWTRAGNPTVFGVFVDGIHMMTVEGTVRTADLWLARPAMLHTIEVAAGLGDPPQFSSGNVTTTVTPQCIGAWFYDEGSGVSWQVLDEGTNPYGFSDDLRYHLPTGRTYPVWSRSTTRGLEGQVQGVVRSVAARDGIEAMWRAGTPVRLIIGDVNIKVMMGAPAVDWDPNGVWDLAIPVIQVDA